MPQCAEQIQNLYRMFLEVDCLQLEVTLWQRLLQEGLHLADAKLGFDDNALLQTEDHLLLEDTTESDPGRSMPPATISLCPA